MKKILVVLALVGFVTAAMAADEAAPAGCKSAGVCAVKANACSTCYSCDTCKGVAAEPGKCCGKELTALHVLETKDGVATCCACGADCKCKVSADDPKKCTCGKDVVTVKCPAAKCLAPAPAETK